MKEKARRKRESNQGPLIQGPVHYPLSHRFTHLTQSCDAGYIQISTPVSCTATYNAYQLRVHCGGHTQLSDVLSEHSPQCKPWWMEENPIHTRYYLSAEYLYLDPQSSLLDSWSLWIRPQLETKYKSLHSIQNGSRSEMHVGLKFIWIHIFKNTAQ